MKKIKSRDIRLRKKINIKIFLLSLVVLLIFYCGGVRASLNDSKIEKNRVEGIYAVTNINGVDRIFYLNMYKLNGITSYCIEIGVDITTEIYHSTDDFSVSYLSKEQIEYIRSISYYGYGYENHNDYKYYMAAQELIWEYLGKVNVEWTNELKTNGPRINIESYKEAILNLINEDKGVELSLEYGQAYKVGEEIVIVDNNNVLDKYEIISSKYSEVLTQNNNLIIKVGNVIDKEIIELKRKEYYNYDSKLYYYDNSQKLISNGNCKNDTFKIEFDIEGLEINFMIVNSYNGKNYPLSNMSFIGATYEIYDNNDNLIKSYVSDENGRFKIDNLTMGDYKIVHKVASKGFMLAEKPQLISVTQNNQEIKISQQIISRFVKIKKVYGSAGNYKPEEGANFSLRGIDTDTRGELTTNSGGLIILNLLYGSYLIHQKDGAYGYSKVDDFVIEVLEGGKDYLNYNLFDDLIQVKVKISSIDKVTGEKISTKGFVYKIKDKNNGNYIEVDGINTFNADDSGNVYIPKLLQYGTYIIEQVDTPNEVILNEESLEFSIDDNSKLELVDGNLVLDINFYNDLVMGQVNIKSLKEVYYKEINKYEYKLENQENLEYKVYADDDIIVNNKVMHKAGDDIYIGISNLDGELIIDNLYLGNYCITNTLSYEEKCLSLTSINNKKDTVIERVEFITKLPKTSITIENKTIDNKKIEGSIFELIDKDNTVIYTGITNNTGLIKIEDILVGNYCLVQKKVVDAYVLNKEQRCYLIEEDKAIEFINEKVSQKIINVPNTLSKDIDLYEIFLILSVIGVSYFVYKKIFCSTLYR